MIARPLLAAVLLLAHTAASAQPQPNDSVPPPPATPPADEPDLSPPAAPVAATGSRADENAVRQSGDAFGSTVGR